mmetsp:Transcript_18886/g.27860  ORF Transcript_18886/g.27860 Transcript_18886/m.27860 type:complete len:246 (-) Transcript_18886:120-857(-)
MDSRPRRTALLSVAPSRPPPLRPQPLNTTTLSDTASPLGGHVLAAMLRWDPQAACSDLLSTRTAPPAWAVSLARPRTAGAPPAGGPRLAVFLPMATALDPSTPQAVSLMRKPACTARPTLTTPRTSETPDIASPPGGPVTAAIFRSARLPASVDQPLSRPRRTAEWDSMPPSLMASASPPGGQPRCATWSPAETASDGTHHRAAGPPTPPACLLALKSGPHFPIFSHTDSLPQNSALSSWRRTLI